MVGFNTQSAGRGPVVSGRVDILVDEGQPFVEQELRCMVGEKVEVRLAGRSAPQQVPLTVVEARMDLGAVYIKAEVPTGLAPEVLAWVVSQLRTSGVRLWLAPKEA